MTLVLGVCKRALLVDCPRGVQGGLVSAPVTATFRSALAAPWGTEVAMGLLSPDDCGENISSPGLNTHTALGDACSAADSGLLAEVDPSEARRRPA